MPIPHDSRPAEAQLQQLLDAARASYKERNLRQATLHLASAEALAQHHRLFRQAAVLRKALTILAAAGKPHLLTRTNTTLTE